MNDDSHPLLADYPSVVAWPVAWRDMDAFGHVNNVVYFHYLECGRVDYLQRLGWFERLTATGIGPIVHSTQCRFRKPITYPDQLLIGSRITHIESDRVTFDHCIVSRHWNDVAAEGQAIVVCYDYTKKEKTSIPADLRERINELEQSV